MNDQLSHTLQQILDKAVTERPEIHSAAVLIEKPGFHWKGASGLAIANQNVPMTPDTAFRSASVGKTVCAVAVMMLVEDARIDLDAPIIQLLPATVLDGLHTLNGVDYTDQITVRHLLSHTSGLADYYSDIDETDSEAGSFVGLMMAEPDRLWNPDEVIAWVRQHLHAQFKPGEGWYYSDTGYLLAGMIIEAVSGQPLHTFYRERIFNPLGMNSTYVVFREPAPSTIAVESHAYVGELDYSIPQSVSVDWSGGGLVTTAEDLTRLIRALAEDRVFKQRSTREQMMKWTATGEPGIYYGLGLRRFVPAEFGSPQFGELWGHTGALGVFMFYDPDQDMTLCGTLNQGEAPGVWSEVRPVASIVPEILQRMQ